MSLRQDIKPEIVLLSKPKPLNPADKTSVDNIVKRMASNNEYCSSIIKAIHETADVFRGQTALSNLKEMAANNPALKQSIEQSLPPRATISAGIDLYKKGLDAELQNDVSTAVDYYQKAAKVGNIRARTNLAFHHLKGTGGLTKDPEKAFLIFRETAMLGHVRGQHNLAKMWEKGEGTHRDLAEAVKWYREAEKNGDKLVKGAVNRLNQIVEVNDALTTLFPNALAGTYITEKGAITLAFHNEANYLSAKQALASYMHTTYAHGNNQFTINPTQELRDRLLDPAKFNSLKNSIESGNVEQAQKISERDARHKLERQAKAARAAQPQPEITLDPVQKALLDNLISPIIKQKFTFNAATQTIQYANLQLAVDGIPSETIKTIRKKLIDNGIETRIFTAADGKKSIIMDYKQAHGFEAYMKGFSAESQKDYQAAVQHYQKAANLGNTKAEMNLGALYLTGKGVEKNAHVAYSLMDRAAVGGHTRALSYLAKMHEHGEGTSVDYERARSWYRQAGAQGDINSKEAAARLDDFLKDHDKLISLVADQNIQYSLNNKGDMQLYFENEAACASAKHALADFRSNTLRAERPTTFSIIVSPELKQKLNDPNECARLTEAFHTKVPASEIRYLQTQPQERNRSDRMISFQSTESIESINKVLKDINWKIAPDKFDANNKPYKPVLDGNDKERFYVHPDKFTTYNNDKETFITMLQSYQKVHGNDKLPIVTASDTAAKEVWKQALKEAYPGKTLAFDSIITVSPPASQPASPPQNDSRPMRM